MKEDRQSELIEAAREVRACAYAPYSKFMVGAAVLGESGAIYTGVNVENASYPAGICAERSAISVAISAGERRILAAAVVTDLEVPSAPCGMCRQTLGEFGWDMDVYIAGVDVEQPVRAISLRELLPEHFDGAVLLEE